MPADITKFQQAIERLKIRRGTVAIAPADTYETAVQNAGIVKDTFLTFNPVEIGPDNNGRMFVIGYDIELQFALMQTAKEEIQNLPALIKPAGNGLYVAITDGPPPPIDGTTITDFTGQIAAATDKLEFLNVALSASGNIRWNKEESGIVMTLKGTIAVEDFEKMYLEPLVLA